VTQRHSLALGALGLPLAFAALPLYVHLPHYYATQHGVSLASLGFLLLLVRLFDALLDPWVGARLDGLLVAAASSARSRHRLNVLMWGAAALLVCAAQLIFAPSGGWFVALNSFGVFLPLGLSLVLTHVAHGVLTVAQQTWTARLGGSETERSQRVAWREALSLLGVALASTVPALLGMQVLAWLLLVTLVLALPVWQWALRSAAPTASQIEVNAVQTVQFAPFVKPWHVFKHAPFRQLFMVFLLNGVASAVPASLLLFFAQDVLQADSAAQSFFLLLYFLGSAASMPLWLLGVRVLGLARAWLLGMVLAVWVFVATLTLGAGDAPWFALICLLSGFALGVDLIAPAALLAGLARDPQAAPMGLYVGWWHFASKINLALAAGLSLPLLSVLGYEPGVSGAEPLGVLHWAYAGLPCVLKVLAGAALWFYFVRSRCAVAHTNR
jgi:glycoside/pentoside/hexuronide:cation symporter, GPH family